MPEIDLSNLQNPRIAKAIAKLKAAKSEFNDTLIAVQEACPHTFVGEAPYKESGLVADPKQEFRVCLSCGFFEEHPYFKELNPPRVLKITREEGYALRMQPK